MNNAYPSIEEEKVGTKKTSPVTEEIWYLIAYERGRVNFL